MNNSKGLVFTDKFHDQNSHSSTFSNSCQFVNIWKKRIERRLAWKKYTFNLTKVVVVKLLIKLGRWKTVVSWFYQIRLDGKHKM